MRRNELASSDPRTFAEVALAAEVGELAILTDDGTPRIIPLNFGFVGEVVYFHGALAGEKFVHATQDNRCSFSMVKALSLIPSYWIAPRYACPATHLFKSVEIRGHYEIVDDLEEKAIALQAMMEKYQPEGGFDKIEASDPVYRKALGGVGVFRVVADRWTAKIKLGQNEPMKVRQTWIEGLRKRGTELDLQTALEIESTFEN